jgi:hypothetical protein
MTAPIDTAALARDLGAKTEGRTDAYLICKYGLYYKPKSQGYIGVRDLAGRFTLEEVSVLFPNLDSSNQDGMSFVHEDDAPEFSPKCWDDVKVAHLMRVRDAITERVAELEAQAAAWKADAERLAGAALGEINQRDRKLPIVTGPQSASEYQAIVVDISVARAETDAALAAHEATMKENGNG